MQQEQHDTRQAAAAERAAGGGGGKEEDRPPLEAVQERRGRERARADAVRRGEQLRDAPAVGQFDTHEQRESSVVEHERRRAG